MSTVKTLIEGYVRQDGVDEYASSSVTLIRDGDLNILVDVGMDRERLLDALSNEDLMPVDIDFVVLTHTHLDHCLLAGIFENAKILDDSGIYSFDGKITEHSGKIPGTDIEIIPTPGHDQHHCAVLVKTDDLGKVAIVADLFWWEDDQEQKTDRMSLLNLKDSYLNDGIVLKKSREKILKMADYIIPGHGRAFKLQ
ncbi:MAG: MBL fold metallo-hydrolase [Patescibacteria group bacterium]|jgi:glyoxylase-like metal-dependent hydrolase (beta-lactamase superfamily II)